MDYRAAGVLEMPEMRLQDPVVSENMYFLSGVLDLNVPGSFSD